MFGYSFVLFGEGLELDAASAVEERGLIGLLSEWVHSEHFHLLDFSRSEFDSVIEPAVLVDGLGLPFNIKCHVNMSNALPVVIKPEVNVEVDDESNAVVLLEVDAHRLRTRHTLYEDLVVHGKHSVQLGVFAVLIFDGGDDFAEKASFQMLLER